MQDNHSYQENSLIRPKLTDFISDTPPFAAQRIACVLPPKTREISIAQYVQYNIFERDCLQYPRMQPY